MTVSVSASVKMTRAAVFAMVALVAASVVPFMADGSSAESFNEDLGSFNSMAVTVQYSPPAGSDAAETVVWNFGDGSEDQTAGPYDSIRHVYAATGTYYITQTATNSAGSSTAVYKITILGYPTVTFVFGHDILSQTVQQTAYDVPVTAPEVPTVEGYSFAGWFTDEEFSSPYNFNAGVTEPITLYAMWVDDSAPATVNVVFMDSDGKVVLTKELANGSNLSKFDLQKELLMDGKIYAGIFSDQEMTAAFDTGTSLTSDTTLYVKYTPVVPDAEDTGSWTVVILLVAGLIVMIGCAVSGRPAGAVIGLLMLAVAALLHFEVIAWPF